MNTAFSSLGSSINIFSGTLIEVIGSHISAVDKQSSAARIPKSPEEKDFL
jgi:hypothetical protein